jgi:hypothetical protein
MEDLKMKTFYKITKERHQKEFNDFSKKSMFFAFDKKQFEEGMKKLGLEPTETNKIVSIGAGGYLLKDRIDEFKNLAKKQKEELKQLRKNKKQFAADMFAYELANHEFGLTYDLSETLDALGMTLSGIKKEPETYEALKEVLKEQYNYTL